MSDKNENKLGWIYVKQLLSNCQNEESFNKALKEFPVDSSENRLAVAKSLLEIGIDRSESAFKRNYVLSHLSTFIRTCDLQNDFRLQGQLISIVDSWKLDFPEQYHDTPPFGALLALAKVNRNLGLKKCDEVIKDYGESESSRRIGKIRECFNDLERGQSK